MIIFVTGAREIGGAEIYLQNMLAYAKAEDRRFILACPDHGPFVERAKDLGLSTVSIDLGAGFGKWRGLNAFSPVTWMQFHRFSSLLRSVIKKHDVRVIHAQTDLKERFFSALAGSKAGVPVVWTEHGMLHPWIKTSPARRAYKFIANRYVSTVICVSNAVRADLLEIGVEAIKLKVIHNGVPGVEIPSHSNSTRRELGLQEQDIVISSVARLYNKKGVQDLIAASAKLIPKIPSLRILVVGCGPYEEELKKIAVEQGAADKVIFAGFRKDVARFFAASDIFASPTFDREGLPLTLLEAMALSKPIVATDVGGTRECVEDGVTGLLIEPRDVSAMAEAIEKLSLDKALRERMGEAGRASYLKEFKLELMCDRTLDYLEEVARQIR